MMYIKRGNDQVVKLPELRVLETQQYLNGAVVTAVLRDGDGNLVQDGVMTYVPDSNGTYEWALEAAVTMIPKSSLYTLEVSAVQDGQNFREVYDVTVLD